ncbi:MAG TPA: hypothetical protein VKV18_01140 [Chthonomonas sp.]|uniref:hypothetical protein n=1 Tax=Chthonomonas sp. TaxID=2282153 RepID=UPI002B4B3D65|nr:hypothetical protein [Chthonomonas sp.]HLI47284.1 hypothetical protein [Chthonomonas sp.]
MSVIWRSRCVLTMACLFFATSFPSWATRTAPTQVISRAPVGADMVAQIRALSESGELCFLSAFCQTNLPSEVAFCQAERTLKLHADLLYQAERLAGGRSASVPCTEHYPFDLTSPAATIFRGSAILLVAASRVSMRKGEKDVALRYEKLLFQLAKRLGANPCLSACLTQAAIERLALENLRFFLAVEGKNSAFVKEALACYRQGYILPNFVSALKGERRLLLCECATREGQAKDDTTEVLTRLNKALPLVTKPYWQVVDKLKALDRKGMNGSAETGLKRGAPHAFYADIAKVRADVMAQSLLTRSALELLAWRSASGRLPERPNLSHWPRDPYTGHALGYSKIRNGFHLYCEDSETPSWNHEFFWRSQDELFHRPPAPKGLRPGLMVAQQS